jgi:ABC-type transport system involved in cytochrome c biogenesis permease subunit
MLLHITPLCFAASYAVALGLECTRMWFRSGVRGLALLIFGGAGLCAHSLYLLARASQAEAGAAPLSSWYDWYLLAAWILAALYLYLAVTRWTAAVGLFLLPLILALVGVAEFAANRNAFSQQEAGRIWGRIHGGVLLLGTVSVSVGFMAGLMYLVHASRLKRKLPPLPGVRLPSLEWLDRTNERMLILSAILLFAGMVSGVVLNAIHRAQGTTTAFPWTDPAVWSSGRLAAWLAAAVIFTSVSRPARQGRKVAYLTIASFLLLVFILAVLLFLPSQHAGNDRASPPASAGNSASSLFRRIPSTRSVA